MLPSFVSPGSPVTASWANAVVSTLRELRRNKNSAKRVVKAKAAALNVCYFGSLLSEEDKTFIRGGIVYCGDKNFLVENKELDLEGDSEDLIYLEVSCQSNRDDDNEIFLPGVKTSSWDKSWENADAEGDYPDNDHPDVSSGIGTVVVPLGKLTIKDGIAKFEPLGCGNVRIHQCAGILSHTRE